MFLYPFFRDASYKHSVAHLFLARFSRRVFCRAQRLCPYLG